MAIPIPHSADRAIRSGSGKTIIADRPANLAAGQRWQVGIIARDGGAGVPLTDSIITPPESWQLVRERPGDFNATTMLLVYALRVAGASEPASVNFVVDAEADYTPGNWFTISDRITGAANELADVTNRNLSFNNQQQWDAPNITTQGPERLVCRYWTFAQSGGVLTADPALFGSWSEVATGGTGVARMCGGYEDQEVEGPTATRTATTTGSAGRWQSITFALAPEEDDPEPEGPKGAFFYTYLRGDHPSVSIVRGASDPALRTIPVTLVQEDGVTPADVDVTGFKPLIRRLGSDDDFAPVEADLHKVSGLTGEYEVRLTQAEADQEPGNYRGIIPLAPPAIQTPFTFQIMPPQVFKDPATVEDLAVVTVEEIDSNSTKLDIPVSGMLFPEITDEGARTIVFRDKNGNVVAQGTFNRDNVSRLPFTDIDPDEE